MYFFLLSYLRTGLEAIMETYAFWRPPVRTLTFEDFTNMQKQQGVYGTCTFCDLESHILS